MRNEFFSQDFLRLNSITEGISAVDDSDYDSVFDPASRNGSLSTNPQNSQRERKKEAKKRKRKHYYYFCIKDREL